MLCAGDNEKAENTATVADGMKSGHPKATTAWYDCELVRLCLCDRKASAPELKSRWTEASEATMNT